MPPMMQVKKIQPYSEFNKGMLTGKVVLTAQCRYKMPFVFSDIDGLYILGPRVKFHTLG